MDYSHEFDERMEAMKKDVPEPHVLSICPLSDAFREFAEPFILEAAKRQSYGWVKKSKLIIAEKYMVLRLKLPTKHKKKGHTCLYETFVDLWEKLDLIEAMIATPIFLPEEPKIILPPPRPEPRQVGGIFIAEADDE